MIAIDVNDGQLKLAEEMGADLTINSRTEDAAKIVQEKPVARTQRWLPRSLRRRLIPQMPAAPEAAWWQSGCRQKP